MAERARYIGKAYAKYPVHGFRAVHLFYEYRGHEYMITDPRNGCMFNAAQEHRYQQELIDREIAEAETAPAEWQYEGSAQQAFDEFYEWMEG